MASKSRTWTGLDVSAIPLLYTAIERAALAKHLDFTDPAPTELADVDLTETVDPDEWDQDEQGIAPLASSVGSDSLMLENVVARICLESVQHRLPQWASVSEGRVTLARRISKRRQIIRDLQPRYLFEINWADSGPGFSWPEKYHVTYLPGYDISVVTASADGPDAHGYADFAIGWFPGAELREEEARRCVTGWWDGAARLGPGTLGIPVRDRQHRRGHRERLGQRGVGERGRRRRGRCRTGGRRCRSLKA